MNPLRKYRPRPQWKPRNKFPQGKPRSTRGSLQKGRLRHKVLCSTAAGQPSSRRLNRLPEWTDPRSYITPVFKLHRLFGEDKTRLRLQIFERTGGLCESPQHVSTCPLWASFEYGEMSHRRHGSNKTDTLEGAFWSTKECHQMGVHGLRSGKKEKAA